MKEKKQQAELLTKMWGLDVNRGRVWSEAYADHYHDTIQANNLLAQTPSPFDRCTEVIELVNLVKCKCLLSIADVTLAVQQACSGWMTTAIDGEAAHCALKLALKLWLFSEPSLNDPSQMLIHANRKHYEPGRTSQNPLAVDIKSLSTDFSAKSLTRKGGFYLVWTSDLSQHLTFASKDQIRVFRHARILEQYQRGLEGYVLDEVPGVPEELLTGHFYRQLFPDCFLEETRRTIHLLFPFEDLKTSKRIRRICKRNHVDIEAPLGLEAALEEHGQYQIRSYQFYGTRLAEIQRRYDQARPHRLQQWWYDRRQRPEWAALMVALIVFALTVVFGVIQTVTGIMQLFSCQ